jgi:hypothetical protein
MSVPDYKTLENDPIEDLDFWHLIGMAAVAQSPVTLPGESTPATITTLLRVSDQVSSTVSSGIHTHL